MTELTASVLIRRDPADAFAFLSNPENNPTWQRGMRSCTIQTDPPFGVGSRYDQVAGFAGKKIVSTFEIIEYVDGRLVVGTTIEGSFPITFRRSVEAERDGARVTARITGNEEGFFDRASRLLRWMAQRSVTKDYKRLKRLLLTPRTGDQCEVCSGSISPMRPA
ncbi:MAG: SRPBCC family protein [Acidimicrobiia bacterium]